MGTTSKHSWSRRDFLKGAAAGTMSVAAMGALGGCAPQQSENAGAAAPSGDGGAVPQEQKLTPEQQAVIDGAEGTTNEDIDENYYPGKEEQARIRPRIHAGC